MSSRSEWALRLNNPKVLSSEVDTWRARPVASVQEAGGWTLAVEAGDHQRATVDRPNF
jgi:hypothetical protein